ncbi:MAG: hydroxymethylbilane synthase [Desulfobacteraceae bacterium]|nr:hydroxymethylbilane synthase [Desulfobacteraceae bacterium]
MKKTIRIATRKSLLALTQSTWIKEQIEARNPGVSVELVKIVTKGDKITDVPLAKVGGKGLFVKEIEEAMLRGEADLAVHSMKDVPAELPDGLFLGVVPQRENPRDAFVCHTCSRVRELPQKARVGTSSLRRRAQLAHLRPDLEIVDLRGNVETRLRKLDEGEFDAVILATAGLNRLGLSARITSHLAPEEMLPAVAQGALGLELRRNDPEVYGLISFLHHEETAVAVEAERAFLKRLEGGCQVPLGAYAELRGGKLTVTGLIAAVDGSELLRRSFTGPPKEAASLGVQLAEALLAMGGQRILAEVYGRPLA